jgi:hypothetical protein
MEQMPPIPVVQVIPGVVVLRYRMDRIVDHLKLIE